MSEIWNDVVGFEGLYAVSDLGRVRSLDRVVICGGPNGQLVRKHLRGRVLRPGPRPSGHLTVVLGGVSRNVHALVLESFVGPRPFPAAQARHLNGNEKDNRLANLAWGSRARNTSDRKWHRGSSIYKLTPHAAAQVKARLRSGAKQRDIAQEFGISRSTVTAINTGRFHTDVA